MDDAILSEVYVQDLQCGEPVEPHYYVATFEDICVYFGEELPIASTSKEYYYPHT